MRTRRILITSLAVALFVLFIVYSAVEFRGIFLGPKIHLYTPEDGTTVDKPIMLMEGTLDRAKELTINGNKILIDTTGHFNVNLVLSPGYNIISIVATDSRGAKQTSIRNIYYESETLNQDNEIAEEATTSIPIIEASSTASTSNSN